MAKNETNAKNSAQNSQDEQSKNGAKQAYKNANDTKPVRHRIHFIIIILTA